MPDLSWALIRNTAGHFHPALVHFPVALVLSGAALEAWSVVGRKNASRTARLLIVLGFLGAVGAVATGLSLFRPEDFQGRTLAAAQLHRSLGFAALAAVALTAAVGGVPGRGELRGARLALYRVGYGASGLLVGLAGHYGGWIVFGWGSIWTP